MHGTSDFSGIPFCLDLSMVPVEFPSKWGCRRDNIIHLGTSCLYQTERGRTPTNHYWEGFSSIMTFCPLIQCPPTTFSLVSLYHTTRTLVQPQHTEHRCLRHTPSTIMGRRHLPRQEHPGLPAFHSGSNVWLRGGTVVYCMRLRTPHTTTLITLKEGEPGLNPELRSTFSSLLLQR